MPRKLMLSKEVLKKYPSLNNGMLMRGHWHPLVTGTPFQISVRVLRHGLSRAGPRLGAVNVTSVPWCRNAGPLLPRVRGPASLTRTVCCTESSVPALRCGGGGPGGTAFPVCLLRCFQFPPLSNKNGKTCSSSNTALEFF